MLRTRCYALSLKQPWAALVVAGIKTIEVRKWPTRIRGRVYIHAARVSDDRAEAWQKVPEEHQALAQLSGGIIGTADITSCIRYRSQSAFAADSSKHLNDPSWFESPQMYGFTFRDAKAMEFVRYKGNVRFFTVDVPEKN